MQVNCTFEVTIQTHLWTLLHFDFTGQSQHYIFVGFNTSDLVFICH